VGDENCLAKSWPINLKDRNHVGRVGVDKGITLTFRILWYKN
jgi:hypothetical protein